MRITWSLMSRWYPCMGGDQAGARWPQSCRYGRDMRIGYFGGTVNDGTIDDVGVTDFAAVEFPGNPDEAAATRAAVKAAMG